MVCFVSFNSVNNAMLRAMQKGYVKYRMIGAMCPNEAKRFKCRQLPLETTALFPKAVPRRGYRLIGPDSI